MFIIIGFGINDLVKKKPASTYYTYEHVDDLINQMTLDQKIGQMSQLQGTEGNISGEYLQRIRNGELGSILNESDPGVINKLQKIAVEESDLGIPLLFARDIIHGYKTIFPINIGMAASFNPELIHQTSEAAALEAYSNGIRWTFSPMVDISRDPRWGRMAEGFGEDPYLVSELGKAFHRGFIGPDPENPFMATCAKHFAGYGATEGGRDYNTVILSETELYNVHLKPFEHLIDDGVSTVMTSFSELNGIPPSGSVWLNREVLRSNLGFDGVIVSDWNSIPEMIMHAYARDEKDAALKAIKAGIDMEMASSTYRKYLKELIAEGSVDEELINEAVRRILKLKIRLGLFENPYANTELLSNEKKSQHLELAKEMAVQSLVLLKNDNNVLPLEDNGQQFCIIGPMANDKYEQLGTWIFDGDTNLSITPLMAFEERFGKDRVCFVNGLKNTRDHSREGFDEALEAASKSDFILYFVGEESILTGEAHSKAFLDLPGAQEELIRILAKSGKPLILIMMTPRPLAIGEIEKFSDAIIYAWHPGSMGGPAILDVIMGNRNPSGKLPVTFPKTAGQIPIYYAHKNSGRPATDSSWTKVEDIPERAFQTSIGNTNHYMDIGFEPLYPFGYGLSYTTFEYTDIVTSSDTYQTGDTILISATITNTGNFDGDEIAQLYIRDVTASLTRPVRELKAFNRLSLRAGETVQISFKVTSDDLGFYNSENQFITEPGHFRAWIGGSSEADLGTSFYLNER
ncbi:MAG: glycoside hydrolase family 3 C-terminal domain-containing protein [Bacteroidales bacterium]|nr:glycoside hydrolase family 3 C-terminal domain-containing protein [Bacteroidales bacterium]MCF8386428.1 glycoside hydrolase family 3 C-terminal domain-containing protein [Bacteroidales bacterium]